MSHAPAPSAIPVTVLFFNPWEDFTCRWNNEPITVYKNKKQYFPDWLAKHIRKHLVDHQLNLLNLPTNFECSPSDSRFQNARSQLEKLCILTEGGETQHASTLSQDIDLLNKRMNETHANQDAVSTIVPQPVPNQVIKQQMGPWCDSCDSKGMRHKKVCPKAGIAGVTKITNESLARIHAATEGIASM